MKTVIYAKSYNEGDKKRKSDGLHNAVIVTKAADLKQFDKSWTVVNLVTKKKKKEEQ